MLMGGVGGSPRGPCRTRSSSVQKRYTVWIRGRPADPKPFNNHKYLACFVHIWELTKGFPLGMEKGTRTLNFG